MKIKIIALGCLLNSDFSIGFPLLIEFYVGVNYV